MQPVLPDEFYMRRCLELAGNALGMAAPNPMVGAVIVQNGNVVGEGYHVRFGQPHAEVNAIAAVKNSALLQESTLYVNLEPCAHMGKTPPCSDLIIEKKIPRVVIGTLDPNSLVAGKGIEKLRKQGVEVKMGILPEACEELNRRFFTFHRNKRPFVVLKWAQSADGFIDVLRKPGDAIGPNWISNPVSRTLVHRWRSEEQSILVGTHTVLNDNPGLDVRHWEGRSPARVVLDQHLRIPANFKIYNKQAPTYIFNSSTNAKDENLELIKVNFGNGSLHEILNELYNRQILSVMVEGGKHVFESFLREGLWDEARIIIGEKNFGSGLHAPQIPFDNVFSNKILNDRLLIYRNKQNCVIV